jgi:hypothetical protein
MSLGARSPLSKTFEKATVVAKKIAIQSVDTESVDGLLFNAVERLGEIYLAQMDKRDISLGDQLVDEILSISKPLKKQSGRQGFSLTAPQKKAVELRAMHLAAEYLKWAGYQCADTSATESYDILAVLGGQNFKIEVKGTTSDFCNSVLMTRNEVDLHKAEKGKTGLVIVSKISLDKNIVPPLASGGVVDVMLPWDIDEWSAQPIAYQITKSHK